MEDISAHSLDREFAILSKRAAQLRDWAPSLTAQLNLIYDLTGVFQAKTVSDEPAPPPAEVVAWCEQVLARVPR